MSTGAMARKVDPARDLPEAAQAVAEFRRLEKMREDNLHEQQARILTKYPEFGHLGRNYTQAEYDDMDALCADIYAKVPEDLTAQIFAARLKAAEAVLHGIERIAGRRVGLDLDKARRLTCGVVDLRLVVWFEHGLQGGIPADNDPRVYRRPGR